MISDLERLIALQKNVTRQNEIREVVNGIPPHLSESHDTIEGISARRKELVDGVENAKTKQKEMESELEDLREEKKTYRQQLMQVTNQKEYGAVLKEIDSINQKIKTLEDSLLQQMEVIESGESTLEGEKGNWEKLEQDYRAKMEEWNREKQALLDELLTLEDEQKTLEYDMTPSVKETFWKLFRQRHSLAVVPIKDYSCGGCHVKLRPQQYQEVRGGKTIQNCEACMRFLYFDEQES